VGLAICELCETYSGCSAFAERSRILVSIAPQSQHLAPWAASQFADLRFAGSLPARFDIVPDSRIVRELVMRAFFLMCLGAACTLATDLDLRAQQPTPELPGIIVRPEDEAGRPAGETEPPPPSPQPTPPPPRPFDLPLSYPSLSEQTFEGLDSLTRGSTNSIFDTPAMATVVTPAELEERMPQDMFQALQQEVGVLIQRTARGQASPFIRGLTGQQVLILIDGIRMNNSTFRAGANQYFNTIDPGQVERIEVLRGSQSVLYGSDAIGGAINVVSRSASPFGGNYADASFVEYFSTADYGSYSRANLEGCVGPAGIFTGGSYLNVNDLDRGGDLGRQPFTNYDQYAGDLKYNYLIDSCNMLTVALQHFEQADVPRSDRFPPFVFGPPASTPRPTFFDPQQRDLAYLRLQGSGLGGWIDAYMLTTSYARQKEGSRELRSPTRTDVGEFDVNTAGATLLLATDLGWAGRLTYGVDWYHDDVDAFRNRINPVTGAVTPDVPQFPDDSFYERAGAYLSWDVALTDRLNAVSGVRYENIDLGATPVLTINGVATPTHISPSFQDWVGNAGLVYELTDYLNVVGGISEGFRAPNLDDLVATNPFVQQAGMDVPTTGLTPEHSYSYDVGLKLDAPRARSQLFVFWLDLEDNILRVPGTTGGLFQRANRDSYLNGVEWAGEYLLDDGWSVYGNFAYVLGDNIEDDIPLSRVPPTQGIAGLRWRERQHRRWFDVYTWMVRRQDRLNFQDFTDARIPVGGTPGFAIVNVRAGTQLGPCDRHQLSLTLENLFDKAYRVHGSGVDGPGFNAILGYTQVW
jgi:outer membrane receptor protein involved in Fe transport